MSLPARPRWIPLVLAPALALVAAACNDPYSVKATLDVREDTLTVHALNDTLAAPTLPVAVDIATSRFGTGGELIREPRVVPLTSGYAFDVAFDVRGDTAVLLAPRRVASPFGLTRRVGLAAPAVAFESITRAPGSGYGFDSVAVKLKEGETAVVVSQHPLCSVEARSELYAKIGIIDVDPVAKTVRFRIRLDPNCGFRSFLSGVPRS